MSAHTPGPWAINGVVAPDDITDLKLEPAVTAGEFYVATAHDFGDDGATSAANASLITAAPDLLAALELTIHVLEAECERTRDAIERYPDDPNGPGALADDEKILRMALAAIAKARGT